jgi:sortase (surface protein transpeptidase)
MPRSIPQQIRIPSIGVNASIVSVGLNQQGAIAMPDSVDVGAWYNGSPTPGELGPAIIAGHVDNYYKGVGAFFRLRETQVGDMIYIDRADGTTATFKVADIKQVPQANFPTQEVFGNINYAGLRVITCGGAFNNQTYEYEDNIVVFGILQ